MNPLTARLLRSMVAAIQSQDARIKALELEENRELADDATLLQEMELLLSQLEAPVVTDLM